MRTTALVSGLKIVLSEESKTYLTAKSDLIINYLVEVFKTSPYFFTDYLTRLSKERGNFSGRLFWHDLNLGNTISLTNTVIRLGNQENLIADLVANLTDLSIVINEAHYVYLCQLVDVFFKPILSTPRARMIFDNIPAENLTLNEDEAKLATAILALNTTDKKNLLQRIAGSFVYSIQGFAFAQQKLRPDIVSFTTPILSFVFESSEKYLQNEKNIKITKSIDQAFKIEDYVKRVKENNEVLLKTMKENLLHGLKLLFNPAIDDSHSRKLAFDTLGDEGHCIVNQRLLQLGNEIQALKTSPAKKALKKSIKKGIRTLTAVVLEHFQQQYKYKTNTLTILDSLCETCDQFAKLNKKTKQDFEKLKAHFTEQKQLCITAQKRVSLSPRSISASSLQTGSSPRKGTLKHPSVKEALNTWKEEKATKEDKKKARLSCTIITTSLNTDSSPPSSLSTSQKITRRRSCELKSSMLFLPAPKTNSPPPTAPESPKVSVMSVDFFKPPAASPRTPATDSPRTQADKEKRVSFGIASNKS